MILNETAINEIKEMLEDNVAMMEARVEMPCGDKYRDYLKAESLSQEIYKRLRSFNLIIEKAALEE